jgi:uncharacterized membrane protein
MTKTKTNWKFIDLLLLLIGLIPLVAAFFLYDMLPDRMAVHFGLNGQPDGYQSKLSFLIAFGLLVIGLPLLMKMFRFIDPKRPNYEKFNRAFEIVRVALTVFLSGLFSIVLLYNLGYSLNMLIFVLVGIGLLFLIIGNYMGQVRFNYFMGIRTPWTLADEDVWRRTHRLAGPVWMLAGLVAVFAAFLPGSAAVWAFGTAFVISVLLPTLYSYVLFKQKKDDKAV